MPAKSISDVEYTHASFLYKIPTVEGCTRGFCVRAFSGYVGMILKFGIL
jgi:hypothetical protein